jgi:hypothetical protein
VTAIIAQSAYTMLVSALYALVAFISPHAAEILIVAFIALLLAPAICFERRRSASRSCRRVR